MAASRVNEHFLMKKRQAKACVNPVRVMNLTNIKDNIE
jgi:hypothetical protein